MSGRPAPPPTPEQRSQSREIRTPGVILVEGRTPEMFFREFIKHLQLANDVEAFTFGDKDSANLRLFLNTFATKAEFRQRAERMGIVLDAESDEATSAFASVRSAIGAFNAENPSFALPVPGQINALTSGPQLPQVAVFVLPDCRRTGMLETLCLEAIQEVEDSKPPKLWPCVIEFFGCLSRQGVQPRNPSKAHFAGYALAADVIDPQLGRAAQKGVIPWEAKAFDLLRSFISSLAREP